MSTSLSLFFSKKIRWELTHIWIPDVQIYFVLLLAFFSPIRLKKPPVYPSNTNPSTCATRYLILPINSVLTHTFNLSHSAGAFPPASRWAQILKQEQNYSSSTPHSLASPLLLFNPPILSEHFEFKVFPSSRTTQDSAQSDMSSALIALAKSCCWASAGHIGVPQCSGSFQFHLPWLLRDIWHWCPLSMHESIALVPPLYLPFSPCPLYTHSLLCVY